nr:hypothetical protein [Rhodococcus sp. PvR099]
MIDAQVPGNELVLAHRLCAVQGRSAARLRPARFAASAVNLARRATESRMDIDFVTVRRGERERQLARIVRGMGGAVHSVAVWAGPASVEPPPAPKVGAWTWVLDRQATYWTDELFDLYGIQRGASRYHAVHEFLQMLGPEDAIDAARLLIEANRAEEDCLLGQSFSIQTPDKSVRRLHAYGRIVKSRDSGKLFRGTSIDVTSFEPAGSQRRSILGMVFDDASGLHSALVDLPSLRLLRWVSRGLPDIWWPTSGDLRESVMIDPICEELLYPNSIARLPPMQAQSIPVRLKRVDGRFLRAEMRVQILGEPSHSTPALVVFQRF